MGWDGMWEYGAFVGIVERRRGVTGDCGDWVVELSIGWSRNRNRNRNRNRRRNGRCGGEEGR